MKMYLKSLSLLAVILASSFLLSGCLNKEVNMDTLSDDGRYHYRNADLRFSLSLPSEFVYYQTQRKEGEGFKEIEFFVPTSDIDYVQEVPSYAKPVALRIYAKDAWQKISSEDSQNYNKIGEKGDSVYAIFFWKETPKDWKDKWNDEMKKRIEEGFEII